MSNYSITMKDVWRTLRDARLEHPEGLELNEIYVYIDEDKLNTCIHYKGECKPLALIKGAPACILITQYADKSVWELREAVGRAYKDIKFMIENYTKFIEEE